MGRLVEQRKRGQQDEQRKGDSGRLKSLLRGCAGKGPRNAIMSIFDRLAKPRPPRGPSEVKVEFTEEESEVIRRPLAVTPLLQMQTHRKECKPSFHRK